MHINSLSSLRADLPYLWKVIEKENIHPKMRHYFHRPDYKYFNDQELVSQADCIDILLGVVNASGLYQFICSYLYLPILAKEAKENGRESEPSELEKKPWSGLLKERVGVDNGLSLSLLNTLCEVKEDFIGTIKYKKKLKSYGDIAIFERNRLFSNTVKYEMVDFLQVAIDAGYTLPKELIFISKLKGFEKNPLRSPEQVSMPDNELHPNNKQHPTIEEERDSFLKKLEEVRDYSESYMAYTNRGSETYEKAYNDLKDLVYIKKKYIQKFSENNRSPDNETRYIESSLLKFIIEDNRPKIFKADTKKDKFKIYKKFCEFFPLRDQ